MKNKKVISIGLVGHSFCGENLGVGALGFGELQAITKACETAGVDYQVTCYETSVQHPYLDDKKVMLQEFNLKKILANARMFSKHDIMFDMGGGDSFSDIYGAKLYIVQMFIKMAVVLSGTPYVLPPQTYGPFKRWWARWFGNFYIQKSKIAFARDAISSHCLNKGNQKKVKVVTDLGLTMSYEPSPKLPKTIGFNVSGLLYNSNALLGDVPYKEICHEVIQHLISKGYQLCLVPHVVITDRDLVDNDYFVCCQLSEKYGLDKVVAFKSPKEAKSFISQFDFFIGSRMHATIAAVSSGVPTLPLAYSRKFKGVFDNINYPYTLDLKDVSPEQIIAKIDSMLNQPEEIHRALTEVKRQITDFTEIYINELESLLKKL